MAPDREGDAIINRPSLYATSLVLYALARGSLGTTPAPTFGSIEMTL